MARYIELDALIAEIENIESSAICEFKSDKSRYNEGVLDVIHRIKSLINTLEVKEIDLEKELSYEDYTNFFKEHPELDKDWGFDECWVFAKYFFELGAAKPQKGE